MFEAWSVAIKIKLLDGFTTGLLGLSRHLGEANQHATALEKRLASIQRTAMIGVGMTGVGLGILGALKPALEEAKRFEQVRTQFSLYGMGDKANAEAVKFAKSMGIMGTSYTDAMKLIYEAQGVFRESGALTVQQQFVGAKLAAPILAKLNFIESGLSEEKRGSAHTEDLAMLRFIESRGGANNPQTFASIADWGFRLSKSSGGIVPWSQLQQLAATSGAAGFNLSQDAITKLEPVIADLKGGRTGSGLRVAFQRLLGTQRGLPVQAVSEFIKLGLWDPSKVELNKSGGIKQFLGRPGEVLRDRSLLATDPVEFYTRDYLPALIKKYGQSILGDSVQARTERAVETSLVFGPGTASAVFSQIDKLLPAIQRSIGAQDKQQGIDAAYKATGGTLAGKEIDLQKKFASLKEQAGESLLPMAVSALSAMIPTLKWLGNFARDHPNLFGGIISSIASLGVVLTVGGVVTEAVAFGQALGLIGKLLTRGGAVAEAAAEAPAIATGLRTVSASLFGLAGVPFGAIAKGIGSVLGIGGGILGGAGLLGFMGGVDAKFLGEAKAAAEKRVGHKLSWTDILTQNYGDKMTRPGDPRPATVPHRYTATPKPHVIVKVDRKGFHAWMADGLAVLGSYAPTHSGTHDPTMSQSIPGLGYHGGN